MKNLTAQIITILNDTQLSMSERADLLKAECDHRRGDNKFTVRLVAELLSEHILPLKHDEEIHNFFLQQTNESVYENLKAVLSKSKCSYFNAVCGELLWKHYHKTEFANVALESYFSEIHVPSFDNEYSFLTLASGICRIYSKFNSPSFKFDDFFKTCISYIDGHKNDSGYGPLFIINGLLACKKYADKVETALLDMLKYLRDTGSYLKAADFSKSLEAYYHQNKIKTDDILIDRAKDFELEAEKYDWSNPKDSQRIIQLVQSAMSTWSGIENSTAKQERKRLAKKLGTVKPLMLKGMQKFSSGPIDLSSFISDIDDLLCKASFEEIVLKCSRLIPIKSPTEIRDQIKSSGFSFSSLFSTSIIDENGRTRCIVPSSMNPTPEELGSIIEHNAGQDYILAADMFVKRFLWRVKDKFSFSKENLQFIAESNGFIPPDRKESFIIGLTSGFNLDFVTSMHVLMPQVENAFRVLAEKCGAVVYKTNSDGTEECLSFESILKLPEMIDCLNEDFLFNLGVFYTSDYGIGMRNIIGHGLNSDNRLQTASSIAVWWYTLNICCSYCPELYNRVISQRKR